MNHSPQIQKILDRANKAIETNNVPEHLEELRKNFTKEENQNIDEAIPQIMKRIPFTGTPHKLEKP